MSRQKIEILQQETELNNYFCITNLCILTEKLLIHMYTALVIKDQDVMFIIIIITFFIKIADKLCVQYNTKNYACSMKHNI